MDKTAILNRLTSSLQLLHSTKQPERKRGLETLRELLSDEDEISEFLDTNSMVYRAKDPIYCNVCRWDSVFNAAKNLFDHVATSKTASGPAFSLLQNVVTMANRNGPFLSPISLYDLILSKLNDETVLENFAFGFTQLLQNLLTVPHYTASFRGNHWKHIILTLIRLFKKSNSNIPKTMILQTLNVSIIHGSNIPAVIPILRNEVVNFYQEIYAEEKNCNLLPMVLVNKGVVLLCRYNAVEFRGILCKFGETLCPFILTHMNNQIGQRDHEEELSVADFFLIQLQLHYPCDVGAKSAAAVIVDHEKWDELLERIHNFATDAVEEIARKSGYTKNVTIPSNLLQLAVKSTKLIYDKHFDDSGRLIMDGGQPTPKRAMHHRSFQSMISEAINYQPSDTQLVLVQYITAVLSAFPEIADSSMTCRLNRMAVSLLNSTFILREEVHAFLRALLYTEKFLVEKGLLDKPISWSHVWEIVIKSLEVNAAKNEALELIRFLLVEVPSAVNLNSLLFLYIENSLKGTKHSLQLLSEFLIRCTLPENVKSSGIFRPMASVISIGELDKSCPRVGLLRWLILELIDKCIPGIEIQIATTLAALLVNRSHLFLRVESGSQLSQGLGPPFSVEYEDFEPVLMRCAFVYPSKPHYTPKVLESYGMEDHGNFVVVESMGEKLMTLLQEDLLQLPPIDIGSREFGKKFLQLQYRVTLLLNLCNLIDIHKLGEEEFHLQMEDLFDKTFRRYSNIVSEYLNRSGITSHETFSLVKRMRNLLKGDHLTSRIKAMLAKSYPTKFHDYWRDTFWRVLPTDKPLTPLHNANSGSPTKDFPGCVHYHDEFYEPYEHATSVKRATELAAIESLGCLLSYAQLSDKKVQIFTSLIQDCCEMGPYFRPTVHLYFDLCMEVILKSVSCFSELNDSHEYVTSILQSLCRVYHADMNCAIKLWDTFGKLSPVIAMNSEPQTQRQFMSLVVGMTRKMDACGLDVIRVSMESISTLMKHDPMIQWSLTKQPGDSQPRPIFPLIVNLLSSLSQSVRLSVVDVFRVVFEGGNEIRESSSLVGVDVKQTLSYRKQFFEAIFKGLLDNFEIHMTSNDEIMEETVNRISVLLTCLCQTIFAYPFNQNRVVCSLFVVLNAKALSISLTVRALHYTKVDAIKTLEAHFFYTLGKWLKMGNTIEQFPHELYQCANSREFGLKYRKEITFRLFLLSDVEQSQRLLENFGNHISKSVLELIKGCYGVIMSRLILANGQPEAGSKQPVLTPWNVSYNRLIQIFRNVVNTEEYLKVVIDEVVLNVISVLFDSTITTEWNCERIFLPEPEAPFYTETEILAGFERICHKMGLEVANSSIIGYLVRNSPRKLYNLLLTLLLRVHNAHNHLDKFWRLHQYSFFLKQLLVEPRDTFELMRPYVCQFTVHSLLHLFPTDGVMEKFANDFAMAVLHVLTEFVEGLTKLSHEEMTLYFRSIVTQVVTTVTKFPGTSRLAIRLLDFLLKTNGGIFSQVIASLDPFPAEIEVFSDYKDIHRQVKYGSHRNEWTLERELSTSLEQNPSHTLGKCTKERLQFVKQLLAQRRFDLKDLVSSTGNKRFSEECADDTMHNVIQMLLGVIFQSKDEEVVLEACRCLGELGPIDLSVLVLPSSRRSKLTSATTALPALLSVAAELLLSDKIELVAKAGDVLISLLETQECSTALKELGKSNIRLLRVLQPFTSQECTSGEVTAVNPSILEAKLAALETGEATSYSTWIRGLTCGLIAAVRPEKSILDRLLPLCHVKVSFCEEILPYAIYTILVASKTNPIIRRLISSYFGKFFTSFSALRQSSSQCVLLEKQNEDGDQLMPIHFNKLALRCLIRVVQFLRLHPIQYDIGAGVKTPWDNNFWLDVNYLDLARTAQYCGAFLSSILFTEIYAYSKEDGRTSDGFQGGFDVSTIGSSGMRGRGNSTSEIQKLLLKAYISIGESDAVYGCGSARYSDFSSNVHHLQQLNEWNRALVAYDSCTDRVASQIGTASSLKELGQYSTLWNYLAGVEHSDGLEPELLEFQYECGWRLSKWDLNSDKTVYAFGSEPIAHGLRVQKCIYESMQAALKNDKLSHRSSIRSGLLNIVYDLHHASLESPENLYPFLTQLQMFRIVEDLFRSQEPGVPVPQPLRSWSLLDGLYCANIKFQEPVMYLRAILLKTLNDRQENPGLIDSHDETLLHLLQKARDSGRLEIAERLTAKISGRPMTARKELEIAKNHWSRGEQDIALSILGRFLMKNSGQASDIQAIYLLRYGEWLAEAKCENPNTIMDQYFSNSVKMYELKQAYGTAPQVSDACISLARYADTQYQHVSSYVKSEMFQEKVKTLEKARAELEVLRGNNNPTNDKDTLKTVNILQKQINLDNQEAMTTAKDSQRYLTTALRYYLRGLRQSNKHDLLIFRVIGLWLDNTHVPETLKIINEEPLPSYKYIIVLHQLSARLGLSNNPGVNDALHRILLQCAQDHPYHTLPVLLAQALMHRDRETAQQPTAGNPQKQKRAENVRVTAARSIINSLKTGPWAELTIKMEAVFTALIDLANVEETCKENNANSAGVSKSIPEAAALRRLRQLTMVPILTIPMPVSPSCNYKDSFIGIASFETEYSLVGGINSPKRLKCRGTNGQTYSMLLKGQDDLRQDAVMQQVFGVMNKLLQAQPATKSRRLEIRTYKVVPLSQRSGLIEWCEKTVTFGQYLTSAHPRYRPMDYKPSECRKKMAEVNSASSAKKLEVYNDIQSKFKPVFRHFFFEHFKDVGTFYERQLAYTRSVATSSMVGYILGLGDRHVLNILVDLNTAEFIHIDLGVAFEQGRILPTPETVPFRLTRDVVDGMGFSGVEGLFRRSCEMTLDVIRNNEEIIMTILEVLLYDPLYIWTLSADRVQKVQPGGRNTKLTTASPGTAEPSELKHKNNSAARVLLRLKQKLLGVEEGVSGTALSTSGHVSVLIQRALEPSRLSRLFSGWQPYL